MSDDPFISILVAEDNDVNRQLLTGIIEARGYKVWGAIDGSSAMKVLAERQIHVAVVDVNMTPTGGIELARHIISNKLNIPIIMVTGDQTSDLLIEASSLGVALVLQKPVDPEKLIKSINHILKRRGYNPAPLAVEERETKLDPEELMSRVISLAADNVRKGRGRPFAALVADENGKIIGTGANGHASRFDPMAHAEVMAIRNAAESTGKSDLSNCTLYGSSRPTKLAAALIESVGITKVYFGLDQDDLQQPKMQPPQVEYEQICREKALELFRPTQK
ncbi:MAG: response regulator [Micavibrio sp.]|nr:response regulator [Micavibrio sp.]